MADNLVLKTNHSPSYFNKDTILGGMLGLVVGGLALNFIWPGAGFIVAGIGAAVGGVVGKHRQEEENNIGKPVGEPSFWNKDTAIGGLAGFALSGVAMLATGVLAFSGTVATAVVAPVAAPVVAGLGLAATIAAAVGSPILGTYIGGRLGKSRQHAELEDAKKQTIVEHLTNTVSPEVGKAMEYSMEHNKDWGKQVAEERLLAEAKHAR